MFSVVEEEGFVCARKVLLGAPRRCCGYSPQPTASGLIVPTSAPPMSVITHAVFTLRPVPHRTVRRERTGLAAPTACKKATAKPHAKFPLECSFPVGARVPLASWRVKKTRAHLAGARKRPPPSCRRVELISGFDRWCAATLIAGQRNLPPYCSPPLT